MKGIFGVALSALLLVGCMPIQTPTANNMADSHAPQGNEAFLTLNLAAGHPLDPLLFSVNGGGDIDAATLDPACTGFISENPTLVVNWEGDADLVEVFFYSDHDPTLVVQQPDGSYLCGDDANAQILDPVVELHQPPHGQYNIWVGSYAQHQLLPGFLVLTKRPDVNVGNLDMGALVKRAAIPETLPEAIAKLSDDELKAAIAEQILPEDVNVLSPADGPVTVPVTATGEIHTAELERLFAGCSGFISRQPDYVFEWEGDVSALDIFFEADVDTSLVVISAQGEILCSDDATPGENLNPSVVIDNPQPGRYGVFVGRLQLGEPVSGNLTIDLGSDTKPAILAPSGEGN